VGVGGVGEGGGGGWGGRAPTVSRSEKCRPSLRQSKEVIRRRRNEITGRAARSPPHAGKKGRGWGDPRAIQTRLNHVFKYRGRRKPEASSGKTRMALN